VADWINADDLQARLGHPVDPMRAQGAAAAACELVRGRRQWTSDGNLACNPAVREGTLRWAAVLYQSVNAPSGFASYEQLGDYGQYGDTMSEIYRLIGFDPVVA
jgi:hypothetical protein